MPAIFAHYKFGREVLPHVDARVRQIVCSHRAMFNLGLQGPDFYFFDQLLRVRGKKYAEIGTRLHHNSCASLLSALEGYGGRRPRSAELAYLFGLIGHFALDSTCHPHIDAWVDELKYNHHRLETEFDRFLLQQSGVEEPRRFVLGRCIAAPKRDRLHIGRLYEAAGLGKEKDVARLFEDFRRIKNMTSVPSDRRYQAYQTVLKRFGAWDAIGGIFMGPQDTLSRETNARLLPLFKEAQLRYLRLAENYWMHIFEGEALDAYFERDFETEPQEVGV